ncbi:MAG: hypothetical protein EPO06_03220 [Burkholderiaceae bacterium]|nr:MAG: hypothetical protein EPO06_03220 [Burkholderiaceae bacterium]
MIPGPLTQIYLQVLGQPKNKGSLIMKQPTWLLTFSTLWLALVSFLYPIPHTVALRDLVLLVGCVVLIWKLKPKFHLPDARLARTALVILALLSLWTLVQTSLFGLMPQQSFSLWHNWLNSIIAMFLGILVGQTSQHDVSHDAATARLVTAVAAAAIFHLVWLLGYQLWLTVLDQSFWARTPFAEKDWHGVILNFLFALLLAEAFFRSIWKNKFLLVNTPQLAILIVATGLASITIMARIAVIVMVVLIAAACLAYVARVRLSRSILFGLALIAVVTLSMVSWSVIKDKRWSNFLASAKIGMQIDTYRYWQEPGRTPLPQTESGTPVEESAYLRIAWATVALREIERHPLGVGFGYKAFGVAVNDHYGLNTLLESSHSGLLDFTLANGLPGIALWLALSVTLMLLGWRAFAAGSPTGLMLFLFVLGYLVRCALDGQLSGWRLEWYALVTGLLTGITLRQQKK